MPSKDQLNTFLLGGLTVICIGLLMSANDPQSSTSNGRYQSRMNDSGFLILDTATGHFVYESGTAYIGNQRLIKGDFETSFKAGRDLFSKK